MNRRVTLRDIAVKSGFKRSTVSAALKGDPGVKSATRELIMRIAQELGYRPDPMLKALSVYRQAVKPANYRATLAWFSNTDAPQIYRTDYVFKRYVEGARARAEQLGYTIEEFTLRAPKMTPKRIEGILKARGINGIFVAPQPASRVKMRISFNWSQFHAVAFGFSLAWPPLHRVSAHHAGGAKLVVRKLLAMGYRRIGLVIDPHADKRVDGNWIGGYIANLAHRKLAPLIYLRPPHISEANLPRLKAWILKKKPEVLIAEWSPPLVEWLRKTCKLRVPEDIGVAGLNVLPDDTIYSGIDQREWEIGWNAADMLVNMINTHERGIPTVPHKLFIDGIWREGTTITRPLTSSTGLPYDGGKSAFYEKTPGWICRS